MTYLCNHNWVFDPATGSEYCINCGTVKPAISIETKTDTSSGDLLGYEYNKF